MDTSAVFKRKSNVVPFSTETSMHFHCLALETQIIVNLYFSIIIP